MATGLTHDQIIQMGLDENNLPAQYYRSDGAGYSGADSIMSGSINEILKLVNNLKPYDQVNPFAFDEQLAREAATAEYAPYYKELLTDYVADVEKQKSRSQEDLQKTLTQLQAGQEYYSGKERRVLDKAIDNTNKGYAGNNLFFAGAREKDTNDLQTEYDKAYGPSGYVTGQYLGNVETAKTNTSRSIADANTAQSRYERQNARDLQYGIESGVQQRKTEYTQQYETGRKNYYESQFPGYFAGMFS